MNTDRIREEWEAEEKVVHIHGWDFSYIHGRYEEEDDLSWDYKKIIEEYLLLDMKLMDFDTGGGEFLLSLAPLQEHCSDRRICPKCCIV